MAVTKANVSGRRKRGILAALLTTAAMLGIGDGITVAACTFCGRECRRDVPLTSGDKLELCHVISEANGGEYIPANLVIGCFACNRRMRDDNATDYVWAFDHRPFYPATMPNVPAGAPAITRPATDRRHGLIAR